MAKISSKPTSDNLTGLSEVKVPVNFSSADGLALLLSDIIVSADKAIPFARVIDTAGFTSGVYGFPKPDGYAAVPYQLPLLEPRSMNVSGDVITSYQPVKFYQIGNKAYTDNGVTVAADPMTQPFPVKINPNAFTANGATITPFGPNQSVVVRIYKNAGVGMVWGPGTVVNNGLPDAAIAAATELTFVVTNVLGVHQITEWLSPDFVTTNIGALKTAAKSNFAAIVNELFDKISGSSVTYDAKTLNLAQNNLKVIMAPRLGNPLVITDWANYNAIMALAGTPEAGMVVPVRAAGNTPNGPTLDHTLTPYDKEWLGYVQFDAATGALQAHITTIYENKPIVWTGIIKPGSASWVPVAGSSPWMINNFIELYEYRELGKYPKGTLIPYSFYGGGEYGPWEGEDCAGFISVTMDTSLNENAAQAAVVAFRYEDLQNPEMAMRNISAHGGDSDWIYFQEKGKGSGTKVVKVGASVANIEIQPNTIYIKEGYNASDLYASVFGLKSHGDWARVMSPGVIEIDDEVLTTTGSREKLRTRGSKMIDFYVVDPVSYSYGADVKLFNERP